MSDKSSKTRVGVLFGGRSGEHEVSLLSAASILKAIDRSRFDVVPIGITKDGRWVTAGSAERLLDGKQTVALAAGAESAPRAGDPALTESAAVLAGGAAVLMPPVPSAARAGDGRAEPGARGKSAKRAPVKRGAVSTKNAHASASLIHVDQSQSPAAPLNLDVIFPVLHGTFGEDGTIQGLLELAGLAYVGCGVLGSAAGMDKDAMKKMFAASNLPMVRHVTLLRGEIEADPKATRKRIEKALKYPLFVKPANLGSSVGISKVHDREELAPALELAAKYDRKIVVEEGVGGVHGKARELEVAVLGNDNPMASVVGEIVPGKEFYDYEAKYLSEGSVPVIPAKLKKREAKKVREMAIKAFRACDGAGLARVDFLMDGKTGEIFLNEINTMPGFTSISMYPKLWEASGVPYPELISQLIALAQERAADKARNSYSLG